MARDIDALLRDWEFKPGSSQARLVTAADGRRILQMRVELGVLQLEVGSKEAGLFWLRSVVARDPSHTAARDLIETLQR